MNTHLKAILISASGVLLMSLESLFIKLTSISAMTFSFYIGIFMMLSINSILLFKHKKNIVLEYKKSYFAVIVCGVLFGTSNMFFISAIKTTSVANTVMIFASAPIFSALYSYVFYKLKAKKNIFIASFFIFLGLFIIFSSQLGEGNLLGNIYALICVNLFALSFVVLAQYKDANRFVITSVAGLSAFVLSSFFVSDFYINQSTLLVLLTAGLLISPISRVLMGIGTRTLIASEVSLLMIIETIMAPIWVWIFLHEVPENSTFLGGSVILLTLLINSFYLIYTSKQAKV